jgi:hypothetical protein
MTAPSFAPDAALRRRISLGAIDATVCARLGPTGGLGNSQPACFNRQVAMYLASRVGRWSTNRDRPLLQWSRSLDRSSRHSAH